MPSKVGNELVLNGVNGQIIKPTLSPPNALLPNGNLVVTYAVGSNYYIQVVNGTSGALLGNALQCAAISSFNIQILMNSNFLVGCLNGTANFVQLMNGVNGGVLGNPWQSIANFPTGLALSNNNFVVLSSLSSYFSVQLVNGNDGNAIANSISTVPTNVSPVPIAALSNGNFVVTYQNVLIQTFLFNLSMVLMAISLLALFNQ